MATFIQQSKYVKAYNIIFSNRWQHRLVRHTAFWLIALFFYQSCYWLPTYQFPAWKIQGNIPPALEKLGLFKYSLFIIASTARCILLQVLFTYTLIYFLAPKYFYKERYFAFGTGTAILLSVSILLFYFQLEYTSDPLQKAFGLAPKIMPEGFHRKCAFDIVLFNFPAIGGIALSIKLMKRWWLKQKESQQLITAKASAELQLLKAQVHPHFLFNTLNNIYAFTLNESPKAPEMIKKLSGLLHYIIHECDQSQVPLEKELTMLRDYMALEKIRYGEQMDMTIDIRGEYSDKKIAPLLLIPFVENSFKHGASKMLSKPWVTLNIIIESDTLFFMITNSKPEEYYNPVGRNGIGLANVQKRLELLYTGRHSLKMTSEPEHFTVLLEMDLQHKNEKVASKKINKKLQPNDLA